MFSHKRRDIDNIVITGKLDSDTLTVSAIGMFADANAATRHKIIHLTIEDDLSSRRFGGWISNDVYFHLNKYKDIDIKNIVYYYPLYGLDKINKETKCKIVVV